MFDFLKKLFGDKKDRDAKVLEPIVVEINKYFEEYQSLTDDGLRAKTQEFKERIQEHTKETKDKITELENVLKGNEEFDSIQIHEEIDALRKVLHEEYEDILAEILPEAFAVVKDTCRRMCGRTWTVMGRPQTWEMVPYDVQLMGGIVLHQGKIAEMATGEGKTLVATLPVYLNALTGEGVHLVTVNDYLAQRDSEWMGEVYRFHGLSVGVILSQMDPTKRQQQYGCDITYGTNNEFGFDYLRDNMSIMKELQVQRGHNFAIVDEVDSVLIDEARTPLIISGPVDTDDEKFSEFKPHVEKLHKLQTHLVASMLSQAEEMLKDTSDRDRNMEAGKLIFRAHRGLPKSKKLMKMLVEPSFRKLMNDTEMEFLREKGKNMHVIDDELYFVIDEKNHQIDLTEKGREELARSAKGDKNYFVLPDLGTEISKFENDSTVSSEDKLKRKDHLYADYASKSERIHTLHQLLRAYTLYDLDDEYVVTEEGKVAIVDEFTGRVLPGRRYSDGLHQAIEAKENVKVERDTQTLATITLQNYFRMYNKLAGMTGTAETEESEFFDIYKLEVVVVPTNRPASREDEDDAIYRTKREKFNAVIDKIEEVKNAGRPVLVGTTSVDVSETLSRMLKRKNIQHNVLNAKQHQREAEVVAQAGEMGSVTIATNMAGRGTDIKLGVGVREKGGLFILGTERHDSRRIDRQLRGRSGRQGDPGTSKFYLSLEDDLMRLFGSDKMAGIMTRLGVEEGEVIQHSLMTKSVERAQKKVEENNFAIRKRLLEYDNVMNQQREIIYHRRDKALQGERLKNEIVEYLEEFVEELVEAHFENAEIPQIQEKFHNTFLVFPEITPTEFEKLGKEGLINHLTEAAKKFYREKEEMLGLDLMMRIERFAFLNSIDNKWKEHLRDMDDLKEGINLRAYGQKDPLVEYKSEAFKLFQLLLISTRDEIIASAFKFFPANPDTVGQQRRPASSRLTLSKESVDSYSGGSSEGSGQKIRPSEAVKVQPIRVEERVGRNDTCPCGSGKKYKNCHGAN